MSDAEKPPYRGDEFDLEIYKTEVQRSFEHYKAVNEGKVESYRSVMETSIKATQAAFIINGGASLATLTFIGNMITKNVGGASNLSLSLYCFTIGVLCVALSAGARYLCQSAYHNQLINDDEAEEEEAKKDISSGDIWSYISIGLVVVSYVLFLIGIISSIEAFDALKIVVNA